MRQPEALPPDIVAALIAGSGLIEAARELAVAMSPRSLVNRTDLRKRLSPDRIEKLRREITEQLATAIKLIGPLVAEVEEYRRDNAEFGGVRESSFTRFVLRASVAAAASGATKETHNELSDVAPHFFHQFRFEPQLTIPDSSADWWSLHQGFESELRNAASRRGTLGADRSEAEVQATPVDLVAAQELLKTMGDAALVHADIAKRFGIPAEPLRKRLDRWRTKNSNDDGWTDVANPKGGGATYLYKLSAIATIIIDMVAKKSSGRASGDRPPE